MVTIFGLPIIILLVILQTGIISRLNISYGQADLVMLCIIAWSLQEKENVGIWWAIAAGLMLSIISAVPMYGYLIGYILICSLCMIAKRQLWRIPLMTMVVISFLGTFLVLMITFVIISMTQAQLPFMESIIKIILPSSAINMVVSIPVFIIVRDLVNMVYPLQEV